VDDLNHAWAELVEMLAVSFESLGELALNLKGEPSSHNSLAVTGMDYNPGLNSSDVLFNNKHDHLHAPVAEAFELLNSCFFIYHYDTGKGSMWSANMRNLHVDRKKIV
jgi:hypothetical protein